MCALGIRQSLWRTVACRDLFESVFVARSEHEAVAEYEHVIRAYECLEDNGNKDAADALKRELQARKVQLGNMRGEEANMVLERRPERGALIQTLIFAEDVLRELGQKELAAAVSQLTEQMQERLRGNRRKKILR